MLNVRNGIYEIKIKIKQHINSIIYALFQILN